MAVVILDAFAAGGCNLALQTTGAVPVLRGVRFMAIEHQGHQSVLRWRQGFVALQAGIQGLQGLAYRVGIYLGRHSAQGIGTRQCRTQKAPPERAGLGLLEGIETAQATNDHHEETAGDNEGGNPGLRALVGKAVEQRAQRNDLLGPREQAPEDGYGSRRESLSQCSRDSSSSNSRMRWYEATH